MTDIHTRIINSPELQEAREARDLSALADGLNAQGVVEIQSRYITARTILAELVDGVGILTALDAAVDASVAIKYAVNFLSKDSGIDIGNPATQAMVDQITPTVLTEEQATALKHMALQPVMVTRSQVEYALFNPDGTEK